MLTACEVCRSHDDPEKTLICDQCALPTHSDVCVYGGLAFFFFFAHHRGQPVRCGEGYHIYCLTPPLAQVPPDDVLHGLPPLVILSTNSPPLLSTHRSIGTVLTASTVRTPHARTHARTVTLPAVACTDPEAAKAKMSDTKRGQALGAKKKGWGGGMANAGTQRIVVGLFFPPMVVLTSARDRAQGQVHDRGKGLLRPSARHLGRPNVAGTRPFALFFLVFTFG